MTWSDEMRSICGLDPANGSPAYEAFRERVASEDARFEAAIQR